MTSYYKVLKIVAICIMFFTQFAFAQSNYDLEKEIYPKLKGRSCAVSLAGHDCHDSRIVKAYIEGLKEMGVARDEIFLKVAKKFSLDNILDKQIKSAVEKKLVEEAGNKRPQIVIDQAVFNFGQVPKTQGTATHVFKINNTGKSDLIINNIYAACPCTVATLRIGDYKSPVFDTKGVTKDLKVKLQPGKTAELEVVLDLNHSNIKIGKNSRMVFILSNDPIYPSASVTVAGDVQS